MLPHLIIDFSDPLTPLLVTAPAARANYGICLGLRIFIPCALDPDARQPMRGQYSCHVIFVDQSEANVGSLGTHAVILQPFAACEINYRMHDWETGNCVAAYLLGFSDGNIDRYRHIVYFLYHFLPSIFNFVSPFPL